MPITWPQYHWDDLCFSTLVSLHRPFHLCLVAVVRIDEIGTDEEENDVRRIQVLVDRPVEFRACCDPAIVPGRNDALAF